MISSLPIQAVDGEPVIDSRIVAWECGVTHRAVCRLLDQYREVFETELGTVRFQIAPSNAKGGGGDGERYALLTELQATALITLMRNTLPVVRFKVRLAKAFFEARRVLRRASDIRRIGHPAYGAPPKCPDPDSLLPKLNLPARGGEIIRRIQAETHCCRATAYRVMAGLVSKGRIVRRMGQLYAASDDGGQNSQVDPVARFDVREKDQFVISLGLPRAGGDMNRVVCAHLGCSKTTGYRIIDALTARGLIARQPGLTGGHIYVATGGAS